MKDCGNCKACCLVFPVPEVPGKKAGTWCAHCNLQGGTKGCKIYANRPRDCSDFQCRWVQGDLALGEFCDQKSRPDRSKVVVTAHLSNQDGTKYMMYSLTCMFPAMSTSAYVRKLTAHLVGAGHMVEVSGPDGIRVGPLHMPTGANPAGLVVRELPESFVPHA